MELLPIKPEWNIPGERANAFSTFKSPPSGTAEAAVEPHVLAPLPLVAYHPPNGSSPPCTPYRHQAGAPSAFHKAGRPPN